jgi:nucleotide-binding universal stress UspA family protein
MRLLLAIDKSASSEAAVAEVVSRPLPGGTEIELLTVVQPNAASVADAGLTMVLAMADDLNRQQANAPEMLRATAYHIRRNVPQAEVTTKVLEGTPTDVIVQEAVDWKADVIILGSRGWGPMAQAVRGSTASIVASKASCRVEVVARPS